MQGKNFASRTELWIQGNYRKNCGYKVSGAKEIKIEIERERAIQ